MGRDKKLYRKQGTQKNLTCTTRDGHELSVGGGDAGGLGDAGWSGDKGGKIGKTVIA